MTHSVDEIMQHVARERVRLANEREGALNTSAESFKIEIPSTGQDSEDLSPSEAGQQQEETGTSNQPIRVF